MSTLSSETPASALFTPTADPTNVWGGAGELHEVRFWASTPDSDGKIELVTRPEFVSPVQAKPLPLATEVEQTLQRLAHPGMATFYRVTGVVAAEQVSDNGIKLQEVTVPYKPSTMERIAALAAGTVDYELTEGVYKDRAFFEALAGRKRDNKPRILSAKLGLLAAHDLLTHDLTAWTFTPPEAAQAIGQTSIDKVTNGEKPSTRMEKIDTAMSYGQYGNSIMRVLHFDSGYGRGAAGWYEPTNILNGLAGRVAITPDRLENHVYGILDAAKAMHV